MGSLPSQVSSFPAPSCGFVLGSFHFKLQKAGEAVRGRWRWLGCLVVLRDTTEVLSVRVLHPRVGRCPSGLAAGEAARRGVAVVPEHLIAGEPADIF